MLLAFHKPFDVLSQFTQEHPGHRTLAEFGFPANVYPIGRLDRDSEGLILLSDEAHWTDRLLNPRREHPRAYHSQVEGVISDEALARLRQGVRLKEFTTLPCHARRLDVEPAHAPRDPPIRYRASIPTSWVELQLIEGKNRQVRRMTSAVGFPTLRLIRVRIGGLTLEDLKLKPGEWRALARDEEKALLRSP